MIWAVTMPTWGLSMEEGTLVAWRVAEGCRTSIGDELVEIETAKIANRLETQHDGVLRRQVVKPGQTALCGELLGVIATDETAEAAIDDFIARYPKPQQATTRADDAPSSSDSTLVVELSSGGWLRYVTLGRHGSAVVLLHGFGGDSDTWVFNQGPIAEHHRTFAFDLPGHGGSSRQLQDGSINGLANSIGHGMERLGLERVHLVGHSVGAAIALGLCVQHPERIASVSLIAPFAFGSQANQRYVSDFTSAHRSRDVQRCLAMLFVDPKSVRRQMVEAVARYKRLDGVHEALGKIAAGVLRERAPTPELKTPADRLLLIRGMHDNIVSDGQTPVGARLETLLHSGHMPQMEEPGQVNALLLDHFADADRAGVRV